MVGTQTNATRSRTMAPAMEGMEPEEPDPVVGEARWHMAGAVLAAMLLTVLLLRHSSATRSPRMIRPAASIRARCETT